MDDTSPSRGSHLKSVRVTKRIKQDVSLVTDSQFLKREHQTNPGANLGIRHGRDKNPKQFFEAYLQVCSQRRWPFASSGRGYFLLVVIAGFGLGIPLLFVTSIITIFDAEMI